MRDNVSGSFVLVAIILSGTGFLAGIAVASYPEIEVELFYVAVISHMAAFPIAALSGRCRVIRVSIEVFDYMAVFYHTVAWILFAGFMVFASYCFFGTHPSGLVIALGGVGLLAVLTMIATVFRDGAVEAEDLFTRPDENATAPPSVSQTGPKDPFWSQPASANPERRTTATWDPGVSLEVGPVAAAGQSLECPSDSVLPIPVTRRGRPV
eukprot:Rmarinus@m.12629